MREKKDELVTLAGRVVGATTDRSPIVTAALIVGDGELPLEHRQAFVLETDDGRRIEIEPAKNPVLRPVRKEAGAWRTLENLHPTQPTGDFHPDGHVKLRGEWLVPGERVVVIGYVKEHDFVPDTGGHRQAPERQISRVRAIAVGCGDDPVDAAKDAMKARDKAIEEAGQPKPEVGAAKFTAYAIIAVAIAGLFVVLDRALHTETIGLALATSIFALLFFWRASPVVHVPGGAVDDEEVTDPGTMLGFNLLLMIPITIMLFWLGGDPTEPGKRNGITNAGWLMMGLFPLWRIAVALISKPRAEKGSQVLLPASAIRRWILILGLVAIWIATLVMVAPYWKGDGAM